MDDNHSNNVTTEEKKKKKKKNRRRHELAAATAMGPPFRLSWPGRSAGNGDDHIGLTASLATSHHQQGKQQLNQSTAAAPSSSQASTSRTRRTVGFAQPFSSRDANRGAAGGNTAKRSYKSFSDTISRKMDTASASAKKNHSDTTTSPSSTTTMWVDKYAPTHASDLCVAPKKVKEVRTWMEQALATVSPGQQQQQQQNSNKLLILVGSPGIGKSTTVKVLASEMKLTLHEWNDSSVSYNASNARLPLKGSTPNTLLSINYQSSLSSFEDFLQSAGAGFRNLALVNKTKTTTTATHGGRKRNIHEISSSSSSPFPFISKSIILLEELPNLYNMDAQVRFRDIMSRHLQQSQVPTILIFSDVCEGKHKPEDLERLISSEYLYPPTTQILQCHAVTKAKMKKCLEWISKQEGIPGGAGGILAEELHLQSGGDIRHAIMALQFQKGAASVVSTNRVRELKKNKFKRASREEAASSPCSDSRDTKLSTFHALGKLLYAKRKQGSTSSSLNSPKAERPPLDFDPELVMDQSDIGLDGALSFLEYHSPDFFTDVTELSETFRLYSDSATFLERSFGRHNRDSVFPDGYAASLAGRAVASHNQHPTPNQFRSFSAPKVFEVMRKRRGNELLMEQLCKRLTLGSQQLSLHANVGTSRSFVTNDLPFMRTILPGEVNTAMENLHSFVRPHADTQNAAQVEAEEIMKVARLEQEQILEMDDIVDDDDDASVNDKKEKANFGDEGNEDTNMLYEAPTQEEADESDICQQPSLPTLKSKEIPSRPKEIIIIDV